MGTLASFQDSTEALIVWTASTTQEAEEFQFLAGD